MATKTKFPFLEDEVVIANESFVFTDPHGNDRMVHLGERMRSSNPTVRRFPEWFCRDDEPVRSDERNRASRGY